MEFRWTIQNCSVDMYGVPSNTDALLIVKSMQTVSHQYRSQLKQHAEHEICDSMVHHTVHQYKSKAAEKNEPFCMAEKNFLLFFEKKKAFDINKNSVVRE